jgi:DNA-binding transcriptional regulator LsrR (DeoR family)
LEQYLSPEQVAKELNLSRDKVRRMFAEEKGVVIIQSEPKKYKRSYKTLRIPLSVLHRVLRRLSNS